MAKFKFSLEAGFLVRASVRNQLQRSKDRLQYHYDGSNVSLREERHWWGSVFYIQGKNFPDTDQFCNYIRDWETKMESNCAIDERIV